MLSSPAHRAGVRFLRGGLVAIVALLLPSQLGGWSRAWPEPLVAFARAAIPAVGFALAGALGAASLDRGRRGILSFGAGLLVTGFAMSFSAPLLQNLTGFESGPTVAIFAAGSTAVAFAAGGAVAALPVEPSRALILAGGFAAGGGFGGLLTVVPSLLGTALNAWPADAQLFVRLACSVAGLLAPFAIGGAVAGKVLERGEKGTEKT